MRCVTTLLLACSLVTNPAVAQHRDRGKDISRSMRGVLGIELNRDSLASVIARLGKTESWSTGDAGEARVWWCYRTTSGGDSATLLISSDGEMGGPGSEVDEIRLIRSPYADSVTSHCGRARGNAVTANGLRLGVKPREAGRVIGKHAAVDGDSAAYHWSIRRFLSPKERGYGYWNERRKVCFEGKPPYQDIASRVVIWFDERGAYKILLARYDGAIC